MDSEIMAGFAARLNEINSLAEKSHGYVWRLQTAEGDATSIHVFDDERILVNLTVWESVDALYQFVYKSLHVEPLRQRAEWFEKMDTPIMTMWWIPVGHIPTTDEAKLRLAHLEKHGSTPYAFTFKQRFTVEEWLTYTSQLQVE
jgi:hypothetical protein